MFLTEEKFQKRVEELAGRRFLELAPITLDMAEGDNDADTVYTRVPEEIAGETLRAGDIFSGWNRYAWARKRLTLPPKREGCVVAGVFDFSKIGERGGCESMLYVNRTPYQGLDFNHTEVLLDEFSGKEVELTFLIWSGLGGGGDKAVQHSLIKKAHVGYLHGAADDFYFYAAAITQSLELLPDEATERHDLLCALDGALRLINWDEDKFYDTVPAALENLRGALRKIKKSTDITVNCVGHTHIDVAWLWRLKHTREKAMRSFTTALRLMDDFGEFTFLQSQPQLYKYIQTDCPELYEKIRARVRSGNWEPDGGMWLEADCNISSGEALSRQLLHGINFMKDEFGKTCEFVWLPDVFGCSWALPQILKQAGIKTFVTAKLSRNQFNKMPEDLFVWRGIDGSEILSYFLHTPDKRLAFATYNGVLNPYAVLGSWKNFRNKDISHEVLIAYGHGDGGGGVNRDMLKMRRVLDELPGLPAVKPVQAGEFFRGLHERVEHTDSYVHTWDGELYLEYHRGTYTSQAYNKKMNRRLEFALCRDEWLSVLDHLQGGSYPREALHEAWETVLRNQFHDIIPGSSIGAVYADSKKEYEAAAHTADALERGAMAALTRSAEGAFTVSNFSSFAQTGLVRIDAPCKGTFRDGSGAALPAQQQGSGYDVLVSAAPLSLTTVEFTPQGVPQEAPAFRIDGNTLETPFYVLSWDEDSRLTRIYDRENRREVLAPGGLGNVLEVYEDKSLKYDAWDIDIFYTQKKETARAAAPARLLENGALKAVVRFTSVYNNSTFTQDMTVYRHSRRIDFRTVADWREDHRLLKAAFTVDIRSTHASYDIQYGFIQRPTYFNTSWDYARFEVVGHKWADLSETGYGVSLLNDCKYGYGIKDNKMTLSLLKSSKHPDRQADMGAHTFTYSLLPHSGSLVEGGTIEESTALNLPLACVAGKTALDGCQLFRLTGGAANVDAVKLAEKEDCVVLRLHECRGGSHTVEITSDFEIERFAPCNILEEATGEAVRGDRISFALKPFEIKNFKVWFKRN